MRRALALCAGLAVEKTNLTPLGRTFFRHSGSLAVSELRPSLLGQAAETENSRRRSGRLFKQFSKNTIS